MITSARVNTNSASGASTTRGGACGRRSMSRTTSYEKKPTAPAQKAPELGHHGRSEGGHQIAQIAQWIGRATRALPAASRRPVLYRAVLQPPGATRLGAKERVAGPGFPARRRRFEQKGERTAAQLGERVTGVSASSRQSRQTGTSVPAVAVARKRSKLIPTLVAAPARAPRYWPLMRLDLPLRRGRLAAAAVVLWLASGAAMADAQGWNDARTRALVERAATRRAAEIADSALADYHATAHGYVTFLGQFGDARGEFADPPKIVRADELALEVYWRAPDLSKQIIIGQRDSLLAPTDIQYHRDHLGIVQNNFPNAIRLGEGDEVLDVPHPLSIEALAEYDYQIADSLSLRLPDRVIDVYEVRVRPRDPDRPRVVGAVYLDRQSAEVVRMAFDFTRAAYLDRELESVSVVLENALVEGRFWLPRRQDIEIRRMGRWLDFPARGIIRGRWEICCYVVNSGLDRRVFVGDEIVYAPPQRLKQYPWHGRILDSLPEECEPSPTPTWRGCKRRPSAGGLARAPRWIAGAAVGTPRIRLRARGSIGRAGARIGRTMADGQRGDRRGVGTLRVRRSGRERPGQRHPARGSRRRLGSVRRAHVS